MNEPPTLIIWDSDEERTLVDGVKQEPRQTRRAARSLLSSYSRDMIEVAGALTLLVCLGIVIHQQRQVAEVLRETLAETRALRQDIATVRSDAPLRAAESSKQGKDERPMSVEALGVKEKAELEQEAAALIASNDFPAALRQYETLTRIFPDDLTIRDVVMVLRAKLRCDSSVSLGGGACR